MDLRQAVDDQTHVSLSLAKHLCLGEAGDSNLVFSPLSIHIVLSLIAAGSSGATLDEILSFLRSKTSTDLTSFSSQLVSVIFSDGAQCGGPKLSFANGVWLHHSFSLKPSFKQVVDDAHKPATFPVDFQTKAVQVIAEANSWVEKETGGLIAEVLPPGSVDHMTRLIFANALYFKGAWDEKFDASKTKDHDFHLVGGESVQVPFMTSKKKQLISTFDDFKVLGLPYKQGEDKRRFSMYIFLPESKEGLAALIEKVGSETDSLDSFLPYQKVEVGDFRIPKFKFSLGFEASEALKGLGLKAPFSGGGLTEMVDSPMGHDLCVSKIFHKSFIEVNEEGTEAAAASAATVVLRSVAIPNITDFVADHPFCFIIREDITGVVLFVGHVKNPLTS